MGTRRASDAPKSDRLEGRTSPRLARALVRWLVCGSVAAVIAAGFTGTAHGYAFKTTDEGTPLHWPEMPVGYAVSEEGSRDIDLRSAEGAARKGFEAWSAVSSASVRFEYDGVLPGLQAGMDSEEGAVNHNAVIWSRDVWTYEPSAMAITLSFYRPSTGELVDADIIVNELTYTWGVGADVDNDLQNTLVHEVGHLLGLGHAEDEPEATMYPSSPPGELSKRDLHHDDISALEALYPPGTGADPLDTSGPDDDPAADPPSEPPVADTEEGLTGVGCSAVAGRAVGGGFSGGLVVVWLVAFFLRRRRRAKS